MDRKHRVGVRRELCDQFIAAHYWKPPWLTKTFVETVSEIDHHDVVSSGICTDESAHKHLWAWMELVLIPLEETIEVYIVEVIAEFHC